MTLVVADTTPLNYLVLIGLEHLLGELFDLVVIPIEVHHEFLAPGAPEQVSKWARALPQWMTVQSCTGTPETELDAGEEAAILLAQELHADLVLLDERKGRIKAGAKGLAVTGTIGVLIKAAQQGLVKLDDALDRLETTSAIVSPDLLVHARQTAALLRGLKGQGES